METLKISNLLLTLLLFHQSLQIVNVPGKDRNPEHPNKEPWFGKITTDIPSTSNQPIHYNTKQPTTMKKQPIYYYYTKQPNYYTKQPTTSTKTTTAIVKTTLKKQPIYYYTKHPTSVTTTTTSIVCDYKCNERNKGCNVTYVGPPRDGALIGSCFSKKFGGKCSGTPPECQNCNQVLNCESEDEDIWTFLLPEAFHRGNKHFSLKIQNRRRKTKKDKEGRKEGSSHSNEHSLLKDPKRRRIKNMDNVHSAQ